MTERVARAPSTGHNDTLTGAARPRVTAIVNLRGGVGKTTLAVNLAGALARGIPSGERGEPATAPQRVALIDCEPLRSASKALDVVVSEPDYSSSVLFRRPPLRVDASYRKRLLSLFVAPPHEVFRFVPSTGEGIAAANLAEADGDFALRDNVELLAGEYDHIILDLPGTDQRRVFRAALAAADGVIVPTGVSAMALDGLDEVIVALGDSRRAANPNLAVDGILLFNAGAANDTDAEIAYKTLDTGSPYHVFRMRIYSRAVFNRTSVYRRSIFGIKPSEESSVREAQDNMHDFVREWTLRTTAEVR